MFKFKRQSQGAELTSLHLGFQLGEELARKLCIPLYVPTSFPSPFEVSVRSPENSPRRQWYKGWARLDNKISRKTYWKTEIFILRTINNSCLQVTEELINLAGSLSTAGPCLTWSDNVLWNLLTRVSDLVISADSSECPMAVSPRYSPDTTRQATSRPGL